VWRFVAGLTKIQNIGWEEFKRVERGYKSSYKVQGDVVAVGPFLLECLYEAQDLQSCESVFGQYRVKFDSDLSNYGLYALGYCISVCSNTWNVVTQRTPREGLEMLGHGMKSVDYGGGSIEKLVLFGSKGVMNEGEHLLQILDQILQNIKSLKLKGCDIDRRGFENLAECIPYLHSLTSLDISGNQGGDGSLLKLFQALREHGKLQTLDMSHLTIGMDDVAALTRLIQPSSSLRELAVGGSPSLSEPPPAADVERQLVGAVVSPSSLNTVGIYGCEYPTDGIETISENIFYLTFKYPPLHLKRNSIGVKGGTKLSHILRENASLKKLTFDIPLDENEVHDIIATLRHNHSLERLALSKAYHSQYFSGQQALDPRVTFL